jgi:O-antigen ligase
MVGATPIIAIALLFANKNGLQPLTILAFLLGLPFILSTLIKHKILIAPVLALTSFFFAVVVTEFIHEGAMFDVVVLDGPSRHLVAAGVFVLLATSGIPQKYLWYACWLAALTSFTIACFHVGLLRTESLGSLKYWILGSQSWTNGPQAFATISILVCGLVLLTPRRYMHTIALRCIWAAAVSLSIAAAGMTGTRAPFVAIPLLVVGYAWLNRKSSKDIAIMILLICAGFLVISQLDHSSRLASKASVVHEEITCFLTSSEACGSVGTRLHLFSGGIQAFLDRPLIGHGMDSGTVIGSLIESNRIGDISHFENFHNDFVQIAVTQGLLGLLPFAFMLWFFGRDSLVKYSNDTGIEQNAAVLWIIGLILITSMTQINFDRTSTSSAFTVLLAAFASFCWRKQLSMSESPRVFRKLPFLRTWSHENRKTL